MPVESIRIVLPNHLCYEMSGQGDSLSTCQFFHRYGSVARPTPASICGRPGSNGQVRRPDGGVNDELIAYQIEPARRGASLIIVEARRSIRPAAALDLGGWTDNPTGKLLSPQVDGPASGVR